MAEMSRADIQHAVQSALHDVKNDVSRISNMINGVGQMSQDLQNVSRRLMSLEQEVRQIQNTVANTLGRPTTRRYPDPYVVGIANEINSLKIRFSSIEQFASQMSEYIRRRDQQDLEDKQYRTA
jgi:archaellum component FlaC